MIVACFSELFLLEIYKNQYNFSYILRIFQLYCFPLSICYLTNKISKLNQELFETSQKANKIIEKRDKLLEEQMTARGELSIAEKELNYRKKGKDDLETDINRKNNEINMFQKELDEIISRIGKSDEEINKKYTELVNKTHHKTMSALIRDALNAVSLNPSLLDSTRDTNFEELIVELKDNYGDRNKEDQVFREETTQNIDRLQKKINLLLKKAKVDRTVIKAIDGEDITGEVIFND